MREYRRPRPHVRFGSWPIAVHLPARARPLQSRAAWARQRRDRQEHHQRAEQLRSRQSRRMAREAARSYWSRRCRPTTAAGRCHPDTTLRGPSLHHSQSSRYSSACPVALTHSECVLAYGRRRLGPRLARHRRLPGLAGRRLAPGRRRHGRDRRHRRPLALARRQCPARRAPHRDRPQPYGRPRRTALRRAGAEPHWLQVAGRADKRAHGAVQVAQIVGGHR